MRIYKRGKDHPQYNSILHKCIICNKVILRRPSEIKSGHKKCCSLKCMGKFRSIHFRRENHPFWKGYSKICIVCKKAFYIKPSHAKVRVTCSMKCMSKLYISKLKKQNNPNWKNGITKINNRIRSLKKYKDWQEKVFKRDKHTCQKCNKKNVILHAHHIKPFAQYPKLRFRIYNGETLCVSCHRTI